MSVYSRCIVGVTVVVTVGRTRERIQSRVLWVSDDSSEPSLHALERFGGRTRRRRKERKEGRRGERRRGGEVRLKYDAKKRTHNNNNNNNNNNNTRTQRQFMVY